MTLTKKLVLVLLFLILIGGGLFGFKYYLDSKAEQAYDKAYESLNSVEREFLPPDFLTSLEELDNLALRARDERDIKTLDRIPVQVNELVENALIEVFGDLEQQVAAFNLLEGANEEETKTFNDNMAEINKLLESKTFKNQGKIKEKLALLEELNVSITKRLEEEQKNQEVYLEEERAKGGGFAGSHYKD